MENIYKLNKHFTRVRQKLHPLQVEKLETFDPLQVDKRVDEGIDAISNRETV